ncbi:hypothetical protein [Variovorax sp. 38R]|uniref:hypothetical protein n=1 Tax=Variovorax sp. 38R TaxID=2774875 RepID=UPI00177B3D1E|nr:hypothetical protein [Variovorax sp. 38R]QOF76176.1 hypothetical protein IG196_17450 [Variovorax sp. 38R]
MASVPISELQQIPFIDTANLQGRTLSSLTFFVCGEWHMWVPVGEGLVKMKGWPAEGYYFGDAPEQESDAFLEFLDFIAQRCAWHGVVKPCQGLMDDFFNLGATVRKFDLLAEHSPALGTTARRLVITELEYLFSLCRSIFDLLQEVIAAQWDNVRLFDESISKRHLPPSFAKMCLDGLRPRSIEEIQSKFRVPEPLAAFYARRAPFFQMLRASRDRFMHGGVTLDLIFVTEKGFAIPRSMAPFGGFGVWTEEHMLPNELCSLRPAIGHLILETLRACEDYAATCQTVIRHPPPLAPGLRLFARSYFNQALSDCMKAVEHCEWWPTPPTWTSS